MRDRQARRKLARELDATQRRLEETGIRDIAPISRGLFTAAVEGRIRAGLAVAMKRFREAVTNQMVAAHLVGYEWALKEAKQGQFSAASLLSIDGEIWTTAERLNLTRGDVEELRDGYGRQAGNVADQIEQRVRDKVEDTAQRLKADGFKLTSPTAKAELRRAFISAGVDQTKATPWLLETVWRTQTQVGFAVGRWEAEQNEFIQETLWGYEYMTAGDDRVRAEHAACDGIILPKDAAFWAVNTPPNGWNCRCQRLMVFEPAQIVEPGPRIIDGREVQPKADKGWDYDVGAVLGARLLAREAA